VKTFSKTFIALLFVSTFCNAQWSLKLSSNVYLRTWKLDTKANKEEKEIDGATITLFQNDKQIDQTTSGNGGEFTILIPKDGEFYLTVSYPGCNTKRMSINTQNIPENISKDNFKPSFKIIGGFIMVKPYPGINYSELNQNLIRVEYLLNKKAFDDTEEGTEKGLAIVSKIYDAEDELFNKFCSTNKAGDIALAKPDCPLAKSLYEKAISIIPGEEYPVVQLAKVGLCLKDKELAEKKAAEDAAAKAAAQAAEKEKANANKEAENKKAVAEALAKAAEKNAAAIKEEEAKLAKAQNDKAAKEKAKNDKESAAKEKAANQKTLEQKLAEENLARQKSRNEQKEKQGGLKIKQKTPEEIEAEAKLAKQREGMAKSQAEDRESMQADADKAEAKRLKKQKAAREKEQKQKEGMAKSKAEDDAAIKADNEKRAKAAAERDAKEEERKKKAFETKAKDGEGEMDKGNSDHSIPQVLGSSLQKYKEKIKTADELFKMKRYAEAKTAYEEALKYKANDLYATNKLADIAKLTAPK
jgi:hypothetical protein